MTEMSHRHIPACRRLRVLIPEVDHLLDSGSAFLDSLESVPPDWCEQSHALSRGCDLSMLCDRSDESLMQGAHLLIGTRIVQWTFHGTDELDRPCCGDTFDGGKACYVTRFEGIEHRSFIAHRLDEALHHRCADAMDVREPHGFQRGSNGP